MSMHQFERVLLCATGLSPQIVTETLYALAVASRPRWVPGQVRLITTARGAEFARLNLLSSEPGWFYRLLDEYQLPQICFDERCIEIIRDADGLPLDDIRSQRDNDAAANCITARVRDLAADPQRQLHVSIAGGRKTMGYYLGYALSLYGRAQDRLSHVLVSQPFESHRDFYYPSKTERIIQTNGPRPEPLDCRTAQVGLAEIPFVRLRDGLPARLRNGQTSFSEVVQTANRSLQPARMVFSIADRTITVDDEQIRLSKTQFVLLLWLAERALAGKPPVNWSRQQAADEFLATAARVMNTMAGDYERMEESVSSNKPIAIRLAKYFEPHKTRVHKTLVATLSESAAVRYMIKRHDHADGYRVELPLTPDQIEIRP